MPTDTQTIERMNDPQPGDTFTEMYAFSVNVLHREKEAVYVEEITSTGQSFRLFANVTAFQKAYAYGTIPGYWIRYIGKREASFDINDFKNAIPENNLPDQERWEALALLVFPS